MAKFGSHTGRSHITAIIAVPLGRRGVLIVSLSNGATDNVIDRIQNVATTVDHMDQEDFLQRLMITFSRCYSFLLMSTKNDEAKINKSFATTSEEGEKLTAYDLALTKVIEYYLRKTASSI
ncbi:hypothetical protein FZEAL_10028 [Fusarium zealandicum]|uniref:Uncharacterized protein n=1 Tax=Fusarium zealandicum TaxID=1053134 RepID=A0A8H4U6J9_9HYPO|nr:hypothetical protein FZEAL_10028 [Fusarium zealandicum]